MNKIQNLNEFNNVPSFIKIIYIEVEYKNIYDF